MANEASLRAEFSFTKDQNRAAIALATYYLTIAGTGRFGPTVVNVGTSEEDLVIADVTTPGFAWLRNISAANFVTFGPKSAGAMIPLGRLLPTASAAAPTPPTLIYITSAVTLRWIADTAACLVEVIVLPQ